MARFERSRGEKTFEDHVKNGGGRGRRDSGRGRRSSGRRDSGRDFGRGRDRGPKRFGNNRRDLEMTQVICSECGKECEVPFKPTSSKPVYCSDCFEKHDKRGSSRNSGKDLEIINEKLDKIIKALKIK
ncbi:hypothetical protein GOV06_02655 [Candidatus Woesearchaeota archaeon]|nr:hypothetical protein [Candidatus Woesearchaeota archaeon]